MGFTIKVHNQRKVEKLYVLLTVAGQATNLKGLEVGKSTLMSEFLAAGGVLSADALVGCRLYVGYGDLPAAPDPNSDQYYGWIEFTQESPAAGLWINLSSVDIVGLPLALSGKLTSGSPFSLGYKTTTLDIIKQMKADALTGPAPQSALKVCSNGSTKVIAPNIQFNAYKSYQPYLNEMVKASAALIVHTDTPIGGASKKFTGKFQSGDTIVSLTSGSDTFAIKKDMLTTEYLYRCDGGKVLWNGKSVPMNQDDDGAHNAEAVYSNSLFRNICTGINEGYFTPKGPNDSSKFHSQTPFASGYGNIYAKIIFDGSNSYGYPYADGNLKTLVVADGNGTVDLYILQDDETGHYSPS